MPIIGLHPAGTDAAIRVEKIDEDVRQLAEHVNGGLRSNDIPLAVADFAETHGIVSLPGALLGVAGSGPTQDYPSASPIVAGTLCVVPPFTSSLSAYLLGVAYGLSAWTNLAAWPDPTLHLLKNGAAWAAADVPFTQEWKIIDSQGARRSVAIGQTIYSNAWIVGKHLYGTALAVVAGDLISLQADNTKFPWFEEGYVTPILAIPHQA